MAKTSGKTCWIYGGGEFDPALPHSPAPGETVIAADSGYLLVKRLGIKPDLVIGDFDSLGEAPAGEKIVTLPIEKDVTDAAAAVSEGRRLGCTRFCFVGCTGGRPDHTVAAYQLLADLAARGECGLLFGDGFSITAIQNRSLVFPARDGGTLSVFAVGGDARGVTLSGVYYPLAGATLSPTFPLGVSNSFIGKPVSVTVERGTLLVFAEGYPLPEFGE